MESEYLQLLIRLAIWVGTSLSAAIVALAWYIAIQHKKHSRESKENLSLMMDSMGGNTKATESNTEVLSEMKGLLHTVNERLIRQEKGGKR